MNPDTVTYAEAEGNFPALTKDRDGIPKNSQSACIRAESQRRSTPDETNLIERLVKRENMLEAYHRVVSNKGAAGVDGVTVKQLKGFINEHWQRTRKELLEGRYKPKAVKGVQIPKPNGGVRQLGIPTVMDRVIQQALYQVLSPILEPEFSESSYGFRPGKSAQQAITKAAEYQREGKRWVVDMDLAKFFDEVNHDILMARVKRKVKDKKVLKLIAAYLKAEMLTDGSITKREKGTPQGGNLSPLLANIILDDLDKELEKRGHSFCRYADDCNIYVRSIKAGIRVMDSITRFVEKKLKLKVNCEKSAVARPWERKFLGYSFAFERKVRIRVAAESKKKLKENLKTAFRKGRNQNLKEFIRKELNPKIRGWINYFILANMKDFAEELDGWVRRKLRCILWRQWKKPWTRRKRLINAGLKEEQAVQCSFNQRGAWWNSGAKHMNIAFPKKLFDSMGLVSMLNKICIYQKLYFGTAVYGTVRTVV